MGYRSDFHIEITTDKNEVPANFGEIVESLKTISGYTMESTGKCSLVLYDAKWYEAQQDLAKLSLQYPRVRITVYATGEDGERWILNAFGSQCIHRGSTVTFEPNTLWEES